MHTKPLARRYTIIHLQMTKTALTGLHQLAPAFSPQFTTSICPPPLFKRETYCSLWKQGCCVLMQTPPIPLTLHIIYPFPPLFSALGLLIFYNKIMRDDVWDFVLHCLESDTHRGLTERRSGGWLRPLCSIKRYRHFDRRGLCPSLMTFSNTQTEYIVLRVHCQTSC